LYSHGVKVKCCAKVELKEQNYPRMNLKVLDEESEDSKIRNIMTLHVILSRLSHNNVSLGVTTIETNAIGSIR
jgi:hypothetical protein